MLKTREILEAVAIELDEKITKLEQEIKWYERLVIRAAYEGNDYTLRGNAEHLRNCEALIKSYEAEIARIESEMDGNN